MFGLQLEDVNNEKQAHLVERVMTRCIKACLWIPTIWSFFPCWWWTLKAVHKWCGTRGCEDSTFNCRGKGWHSCSGILASRLMDKTTDFYSKLLQRKAKPLGSVYKVNVPMAKDKQKAVNPTETQEGCFLLQIMDVMLIWATFYSMNSHLFH